MPSADKDLAYLWDMLEAAKETADITAGLSLEQFLQTQIVIRATERTLEIIGEAARRVSAEFCVAHPEIAWRMIIGQRNVLAHEYGRIDYEILYKTVTEDIPVLIAHLEKILSQNKPVSQNDG
jgi:uncharacterized protein with HEPN domain